MLLAFFWDVIDSPRHGPRWARTGAKALDEEADGQHQGLFFCVFTGRRGQKIQAHHPQHPFPGKRPPKSPCLFCVLALGRPIECPAPENKLSRQVKNTSAGLSSSSSATDTPGFWADRSDGTDASTDYSHATRAHVSQAFSCTKRLG